MNPVINRIYLNLCIPIALLATIGCATPQIIELPITADPSVEITRLQSEVNVALYHQVNVLSPSNFQKASSELEEAKTARSKNKDQADILHRISVSQSYLRKANENAKIAEELLPGVVQQRFSALSSDSYKYFPEELATADRNLKEVTMKVEKGDTTEAVKQREAIEAQYSLLELNSIKYAYLSDARVNIAQAKKEGALKLTPKMLVWAENKLAANETAIATNRHDVAEISNAGKDATAAGVRLLALVREAKRSSNLSPEQLASQLERDQIEYDRAAESSARKQNRTENQLAKATNELDEKREEVAAVGMQNKKLTSRDKLEKEYETARQKFTGTEAEVYKQGDKLLLRLKGLEFPNNKSSISESNFDLLAKVQSVISESDPSAILIEGHTDSLGSKALNDKLSTARAQAVQSYLKSNNLAMADKVTTKGYGDTKPIASNKTETGRAQNRRVDIIITSDIE